MATTYESDPLTLKRDALPDAQHLSADEHGHRMNDSMRFWREDVSDVLGIARPGGAYGPALAKRIAAKHGEAGDAS